MSTTAYLVRLVPGGRSGTARTPKYIPYPPTFDWALLDYGKRNWALLAGNVDPTTVTTLQGATDVFSFPTTLDANLTSGDLTNLSNLVEAEMRIPTNLFSTSNTWRQVLKTIFKFFRYTCVLHALGNVELLDAGITLNTTVGSLRVAFRQKLLDAATALNLDTSNVTGATTIRQLLNGLQNQMADDDSIQLFGIFLTR